MRKKNSVLIMAILSIALLCVCLCMKPAVSEQPIQSERVETVELIQAPAEEASETLKAESDVLADTVEEPAPQRELTAEELRIRFANMLNLNFCYNANFESDEMMAVCCAISLNDYADDLYGYGIGVGQNLVESFAENFYGAALNFEEIEFENKIDGYVLLPQYSVGTQNHTVVSVTPTDDGFLVVSSVELYYGGDDVETGFAVSQFRTAPESEFGFNLVSCELS